MFGKLSLSAIPFHDPIIMVVLAGVAAWVEYVGARPSYEQIVSSATKQRVFAGLAEQCVVT